MTYYLTLAVILLIYMNLWFVVSLIAGRNDVADVAWGPGFILLAWSSFIIAGHQTLVGYIVSWVVTIWGVRLAWHIFSRNKGKAEDHRYQSWRREWGQWFYLRSYFQVYLLQGFFLYLIAFPVMAINDDADLKLGMFGYVGLAIWIFGFLFETIGDWQLARFIKDPANAGKLMTRGLWAYTRHPNYFGEVVLWWGIWVVSISTTVGWFTIIGPLTITFLILKISGIPLLEEKYSGRSDFEEYKKRTSAFFPMPPNYQN